VDFILAHYQDGNEVGWEEEFRYLIVSHGREISELMFQIRKDGIKEPILLGPDRRIWDGHHRLLCARVLGIKEVPVTMAALVSEA